MIGMSLTLRLDRRFHVNSGRGSFFSTLITCVGVIITSTGTSQGLNSESGNSSYTFKQKTEEYYTIK